MLKELQLKRDITCPHMLGCRRKRRRKYLRDEFWALSFSTHLKFNVVILLIMMLQPISSLKSANFARSSSNFISTSSFAYHLHHRPHNNDYVFKFEYNSYNVTIPENSIGKTFVQQATADLGRLGVRVQEGVDVKFRIVAGDKDKLFKVDERVIGDFAFVTLRTRTGNVVLNREKVDEYRLAVRALGTRRNEKNAKMVWESDTIVNVQVLDRNDLSPLFYPTEYVATIREDMPLHQSVLQVHAEDADLGTNGEIYYSFYDKKLYEYLTEDQAAATNHPSSMINSMDADQFAINPISGVITLTRPLSFVDRPFYELVVIATDRGVHSQQQVYKRINHASKALIRINVTQVNLHAPIIYVQSLPEVLEDSTGTEIYGIVKVEDADAGIHGQIASVEIVDGDPNGHFRMRATNRTDEYNIEVHHLLDRETTPNGYNLTLRVVDKGIPPRQTYKVVPVHLTDRNDNAPVFNKALYEVSVPESAPINSPIIRLKVSDADEGKNAKVFLEIVGGNEDGEFRINPDTGMLYTARILDAESKAQYTLTVSAIDQGNTGTRKQSSARVKITVVDINDNDPVFEHSNVTIWIDENESAGTTVTKVSARDRDSGDNSYISYSIANLNGVPFDIDAFTGIIRTSKLIDYETMRREYVLKIRASDWGRPYRRQTEMQLFINVRDVNDNRPQFERVDCVGEVYRQAAIGAEVLTLNAIDFDADSTISYRLVSGNDDGCFNLDSHSGIISVGCDLHDVNQPHRELNVTATDGTHFADIVRIQINLTVTPFKSRFVPPFGSKSDLSGIGAETNNMNALFECRDTGVIRRQTEMYANAERNNMPTLKNVGSAINSAEGINGENRDDFLLMPSRYRENIHTPEFIDFPFKVLVNETVPLGRTVAWIRARDRDLGYNGKLVYGISDGDYDSVFRIDPETGELKIIGYLDREREEEYLLNVTVYDLGKPQKSVSTVLPVLVLDENDNAPKFERNLFSFRLTEDAVVGSVVVRMNATDADTEPFATIRYYLLTDTADFRIDTVTGVLTVANKLDRERNDIYELIIRATDGGARVDIFQEVDHKSDSSNSDVNPATKSNYRNMQPPFDANILHADAIVRILIEDVNDNEPVFSTSQYAVRVREDVPIGSVIVSVMATDRDLGPGGEVQYRFNEKCDMERGLFRIDRVSGTVRLVRQLDFEERQSHKLCVLASDKGSPNSLSSEATILVEVIDVNENQYTPQFEDFVLSNGHGVLENQPIGTYVMNINARDNDPPGPDSLITFSIRGGDGLGLFTIDNQGAIKTAAIFDIESKPFYWLTVCAQDHGVISLYSCTEVFIEILNENDNIPLTERPVYYATVPEGSAAGTNVIQLVADDGDIDDAQKIHYEIVSGNPEGLFAINSTTGMISTTARKLDRELQDEHSFEVVISDNGAPKLSSTTRVIITVDDINDNSPEFQQKFYKAQIPATAKIDDKLYQVLAYDADLGENARITYSVKAGRGKQKFRMDGETGTLYYSATAATPFEAGTEFNLVVKAEDNGQPRRSQTARLDIIVVDIAKEPSEHAPIVKELDKHVDVTENERLGFLITVIQGIDEDDDFLWYEIVGGDERNEFFIGHDNGNVHLAKRLDWERQQEYNITISISDGHHKTLTNLFVSVLDVNDNRPIFSESVYRVDISEQVTEGTNVLQLHATDEDDDRNLMYYLQAAQNPVSLKFFRVDSIKGTVILTERLDREQMGRHVLIVSVRDQRTPIHRDYATVEITVHDHNDHAPEFIAKLMQGKIFETAAEGSMVLQILATDRDDGENGHITYTIDGGNIGNVFNIDPQLGFLRLNKPFDFSSSSEYILQVKATDNGKPKLSSKIPVHIMVNMADNAPPRFIKQDTTAEIYENTLMGTYVTTIEAKASTSLLFEIVAGNDDDAFFINPSVGIITVKGGIDFERQKFYNLTIRATNMASTAATNNVVIHVLDRNDNAPQFERQAYYGIVSEAAPVGSLILNVATDNITENTQPLVIKAYDRDSGVNALLHFEMVEMLARRYFHIDSSTGAIRTVTVLDHEKISVFDFHVKVSDLGQPRLSSETVAKIRITVTDVNDSVPKFNQPEYNVTLILPTYKNIAVIQLNATDPDANIIATTQLRYDIIDGNKEAVFTIGQETGLITTRNVEKIGAFYRLQVRVSDGLFSNTTYVNVKVETSENSGLVFQKPLYEGAILENSTKITVVAVVNVLGTVLNEHVEFRILNPTEMFKIGLTSGVIETTGREFDREVEDHYDLIVEAKSNEYEREKLRIAHGIVSVKILDVNDNCPMFVNLPYYAVVSVDDPKGSVIIKVHALDLDADDNGVVRYEMKKGYGELFRVDRQTGEVSLKQTLEGHNRYYDLVIAAYDRGVRPCSSDVPVHVQVIDRSMPVFGKQFYSDAVPENIELYSPLSIAIQAESPLERKLIYTIVNGNEMEQFSIDFNSGVIYVVDDLDYEQVQSYKLTVRATDSISGVFADVPVSVLVEDVNDCAPTLDQDSYAVDVSEGLLFGTSILTVRASDNDTGINQQVVYSILTDSRNTSEFFHIDATDGTIYLKKSLDHEQQRAHHFMVVASDKGQPMLNTRSHVWVKVLDMNDNPPKFEQSSYPCSLSEHAGRGQFITVITAIDPDESDHNHLVYNIAHGNEMQTYAIDSATGVITLAANMHSFIERKAMATLAQQIDGNHPQEQQHHQLSVLNISVSDGVYTSYTRVKISILPANLHNPVFSQASFDATVDENQLPGRLVYTILAKDEDYGDYGKLSYDILSDVAKETFAIDGDKGEVITKARLDREKRATYDIPIIATDGGGRSGFCTLRVHVGDENDNPPVFVYREYNSVIYSNQTVSAEFLKIKAVDADMDQNAAITYTLYDSQNPGVQDLFQIDSRSGSLMLRKNAKKWENQLFQFFIRAHDNGTPQLHSDVPVNVYVMSPTEIPPHFEKKEKDMYLPEAAPIGTLISRISLIGNSTATKFRVLPSLTYGSNTVPATMTSDGKAIDSPMFTINELGELRLGGMLDREQMEYYTIGILAESDSSPPLTAHLEIILHVQDENDNVPVFECESYVLTVAENVERGSVVLRVSAIDDDAKTNGDVKYTFGTPATDFDSMFHIDENTGAITTLGELDRERRSDYKFQVVATDQNHPKHSARTLVWLSLKDYNDNPPLFKLDKYMASVSEDSLPGTVVMRFSITDEDEISTPTEYYIYSGDPASQFQIRNTGELYVAQRLDREVVEEYNLGIIVSDGRHSTTTNLSITVEDANDNPPYCMKYRYQTELFETINPKAEIMTILARDDDAPANAKFRFFLTGSGSEDFTLDMDNGKLRVDRMLDRETRSKYHLEALVQDKEYANWNCSSLIEIKLLDVNDNPPEFSLNTYTVTMSEASEVGTLVTKVHATDPDSGVNRRIDYEFLDSGDVNNFKIIPDFGIITLAKPLDRETKSTYNVVVRARDNGNPRLSSTTSVLVNVQDINDNPPEFMSKHYFVSIPEITTVGTDVITVLATSLDTGVNAEVWYSIISGNEQKKFAINNKTGSISVTDALDYERSREFVLTIQAIDGGTPPLSNLATVNISVTDSNDNAPVFTQPSYVARIREDALVDDMIIQVQATDIDSGDNGKVVYRIERGDRHHQFHIDEETGYISVAAPLDRESISSYVLEVLAQDNGSPVLSTYALINIEVSDSNDNAPIFGEQGQPPQNYTAVVKEDNDIGAIVLKFQITDADMSPNGPPYTFDIRNGNDNGAFRLEQDGVLRTAARFNHKVTDSYTLQIRVFDNGTPPLYSDTFVLVKVIEESQYPPVIIPLEVTINSYRDEYKGGRIGRIHATDQDAYDNLIYRLAPTNGVGYDTSNLFNVSETTGQVFALPNLDLGEYRVNVTVSDGKFTTHTLVKVAVELISDEMVRHGVIIRFRNVSPKEFLMSHKKQFARSVRGVMGVRMKDVIIIAMQPAEQSDAVNMIQSDDPINDFIDGTTTKRVKRSDRDLDLLFAIRKMPSANTSITPSGNSIFFSRGEIIKGLEDNVDEIEDITKLTINEIVKSHCDPSICGPNGKCSDKTVLNTNHLTPISIDVTSFVAARFHFRTECKCREGYGGEYCTEYVNECARNPCPPYQVCVAVSTIAGDVSDSFECKCPDGFTGPTCEKEVSKCNNEVCFTLRKPISFSGKSFAHYRVEKMQAKQIVEGQFQLSMLIRTAQKSGTLMYSAGKIDFNILEIYNGVIQYRFDLGSGEGIVSVGSISVSDGQWHEVKLERAGNSAKLIVDAKHTAQGSAPGVNGVLNVQSNDIYFGAELREHPKIIGFEDLRRGFIGCMDKITIAHEMVPLYKSHSGNAAVSLQKFTNIDFSCDADALKPVGICDNYPCFNGGTCKDLDNANFECHCHSRFAGPACKEDLDPCSSAPCLYGGTCRADITSGNFTCECPPKMTGKRCDYGRFCLPNPCRNGGQCEEGDSGPLCMCRGYTGPTCEIDIDECQNMPCDNGATCANEPGSFRCICPPHLTGSNCGDPMYSNTIRSKILSYDHYMIVSVGVISLVLLIVVVSSVVCLVKQRRRQQHRLSPNNRKYEAQPVINNPMDNRTYKMSNLEVSNQRPASYTGATIAEQVPLNNATTFMMNLETLRNYGSAGDELTDEVQKYAKPTTSDQLLNMNNGSLGDDSSKSGHNEAKCFSNKKQQQLSPGGRRPPPQTYQLSGILPGKLTMSAMNGVNVANQNQANYEEGSYDWDCSDWGLRRSQNPLPNITSVPVNEIADTSSFHSNESNESQPMLARNGAACGMQKLMITLPPEMCQQRPPSSLKAIDPVRDIDTLNEELETSDQVGGESNSEFENFDTSRRIQFANTDSINCLSRLDSSSEDYQYNTGSNLSPYPNAYLPAYNIQSETEYESERPNIVAGNGNMKLLNTPINSQMIIDSDNGQEDGDEDEGEDDIPAYGFPSQPTRNRNRNRCDSSDIDQLINDGDEEQGDSLLPNARQRRRQHYNRDSVSNVSVQLCEIEDSDSTAADL